MDQQTKATTVISVRGRNRDELLADPDFVYVGRAVRWTPWTASVYGNPFTRGEWPGDDAVARYRRHALSHPNLMRLIAHLKGKTLGCWCGSWRPGQPPIGCHAVVLAELAEAAR